MHINTVEWHARIKARRIEKRLTARAAAELCGLSESYYHTIERGRKISFEIISRIAEALDLDVLGLFLDANPEIDELIKQKIFALQLSPATMLLAAQLDKIPETRREQYFKAIYAILELA